MPLCQELFDLLQLSLEIIVSRLRPKPDLLNLLSFLLLLFLCLVKRRLLVKSSSSS
jgi:hypothetical protein